MHFILFSSPSCCVYLQEGGNDVGIKAQAQDQMEAQDAIQGLEGPITSIAKKS